MAQDAFGNWINPDTGTSQLGNTLSGYGAGAMGIAGGLQDLLGPTPGKGAAEYFNQIPDVLKQYYSPYISSGQDAMGQLTPEYGQLMHDPGSVLGRIGAGYQQSPGFEWQKGQGLAGIQNAMAAGGMTGSPEHEQRAGELASNLAKQDYYDYLDRALGLYGKGLGGLGGREERGFGASTGLADSLANQLSTQGQLSYLTDMNKQQRKRSGIGGLFGGLGTALSSGLSGGLGTALSAALLV